MKAYSNYLYKYLSNKLINSKTNGFILGISGGIDSTVVAYLLEKINPKKNLYYYIPFENVNNDDKFVNILEKSLKIKINRVNLLNTYHAILKELPSKDLNFQVSGNIKSRLRMTYFYAIANKYNYLTISTVNYDEYWLGRFTKNGTGNLDINPLIKLNKKQVYKLAKFLSVPKEIINRPPTASCFHGQTDEKNMGFKYDDLEKFHNNKKIFWKAKKLIIEWHKKTSHKRIKNFPKNFF